VNLARDSSSALELRQVRHEKLSVVERDERPLEARTPEEPHRSRVEHCRIFARNQDEQRGGLVEADVRQVGRCRTGREQVAAGASGRRAWLLGPLTDPRAHSPLPLALGHTRPWQTLLPACPPKLHGFLGMALKSGLSSIRLMPWAMRRC
jgi:hypothetical protein